MTKAILQIATPRGISLHVHFIVGSNGHTSLKGEELIQLAPPHANPFGGS
jgi:DNA repair protein RadC